MKGSFQRIVGPTALGGSVATLYTVPSGIKIVVRGIHASNSDAAVAHQFSLSIGFDTAGTRIYSQFNLPPAMIEDNFCPFVLQAGEFIQGFADTASVICLVIIAEVFVVP